MGARRLNSGRTICCTARFGSGGVAKSTSTSRRGCRRRLQDSGRGQFRPRPSGWSIPRSANWCGSIKKPAPENGRAAKIARQPRDRRPGRVFVAGMADNGIRSRPETSAAKQVIIKLALPASASSPTDRTPRRRRVRLPHRRRHHREVTEPARMHAGGVALEYPMTHRPGRRRRLSWFTGTVQVIDARPARRSRCCDFKARDAVKLGDGSVLVGEAQLLVTCSRQREHGGCR